MKASLTALETQFSHEDPQNYTRAAPCYMLFRSFAARPVALGLLGDSASIQKYGSYPAISLILPVRVSQDKSRLLHRNPETLSSLHPTDYVLRRQLHQAPVIIYNRQPEVQVYKQRKASLTLQSTDTLNHFCVHNVWQSVFTVRFKDLCLLMTATDLPQ